MRRVAAIILMMLLPATALAQSSDVIGEAESHYEAGLAAFKAGDFAKAAAEFQRSYYLVPKPELLYNASLALARSGDVAGARDIARDAVATTLPADVDAKFRARLHGWNVVDRAQIPVEPPERLPYALPHPDDGVRDVEPVRAAPETSANGVRIAAYVTGGLGLAALGTAGVLELQVRGVGRDLDDAAARNDLDDYTSLLERGRNLQNLGRISVVAGTTLLATGVVLWIVSRKKRSDTVVLRF